MRGAIAILLMLTACQFDHGQLVGDVGKDARGVDAPLDAFNALCYGKAPFSLCVTSPPTRSVVVTGNIDTDGATTCAIEGVVMTVGGAPACVLSYIDVSFAAGTTGVSGDKPLVIVASGTLTLAGPSYLDLASVRGSLGPNANPSDCGAPGNGGAGNNGGGGGAGGSFGTAGFPGAGGGAAGGGPASGAVATPVTKLRGGCPGGNGGPGGGGPGDGGPGGGAVLLIARSMLTIDGTIDASGGGGEGGKQSKGGAGGGGSGGMIVLHGNPLVIGGTAKIFANGGGGGGGAGNNTDGQNGGDATAINMPAPGGGTLTTPTAGTTAGGNGATRTSPAGMPNPTTSGTGGGGGGGGLGVIRLLTPPTSLNNANFSPAPS